MITVKKLTLEEFNSTPDGEVILYGTTIDGPDGCNMSGSGKELRWMAKKGHGDDWAIYVGWATHIWSFIKTNGDKVKDPSNIKRLVPCEDAVFDKYRF